jgi:hypothetical protein
MKQVRIRNALFVAGLGAGLLSGMAQAQSDAQALAIGVTQPTDHSLHLVGVTATRMGDTVQVIGRVSRDLRAQVLGNKTLRVELRGADGTARLS